MLNTSAKLLQLTRIGLAARRLSNADEADKQHARKVLADLFGGTRGATMKIGQFLAGHEDNNVYASLVTGIEPLPSSRILAELESAYNQSSEEVFREFNESPFFSFELLTKFLSGGTILTWLTLSTSSSPTSGMACGFLMTKTRIYFEKLLSLALIP